jgi:ribosomal protein S18 acetylase RimI-like enzyme
MIAMSGKLAVRPFREGDEEAVARAFSHAFADKMRTLSGVAEEDWADLLMEAGVLPLVEAEGNLVAEVDGKVIGVMSLDWKGRRVPPVKPLPKSGRFSWWTVRKVRIGQWVLDQSAGPGEAYVEFIGVDPAGQGRGAGTALLEEGETITRERGLARYVLYVAADNAGAKRLYERVGFREVGRIRSRTTRRMFGVGEWVRMVKALD